MKQFYSKRNNVILTDDNIVIKSTPNSRNEAEILKYLYKRNVRVPKVYSYDDMSITMEYINGQTLVEYIVRNETKSTPYADYDIVYSLSDWFKTFYNAVENNIIRSDVNCRNFIVTEDNEIFSVDFESLHSGFIEEDLGKLSAYIITYDPADTYYKRNFVNSLIDIFDQFFTIDYKLLNAECEKELAEMELRRPRD